MLNHRGICVRALQTHPCRSLPFQLYREKPDGLELKSATTRLPYSTTGYGDGEGDPKGQDPVAQGVNRRSRELEHPGPSQHNESSNSQSSSHSKTPSEPQKQDQEKKEDTTGSAKGSPNKPRTRV